MNTGLPLTVDAQPVVASEKHYVDHKKETN